MSRAEKLRIAPAARKIKSVRLIVFPLIERLAKAYLARQ
jgi:hypothetical protein